MYLFTSSDGIFLIDKENDIVIWDTYFCLDEEDYKEEDYNYYDGCKGEVWNY